MNMLSPAQIAAFDIAVQVIMQGRRLFFAGESGEGTNAESNLVNVP
jgi:hypothetical protein